MAVNTPNTSASASTAQVDTGATTSAPGPSTMSAGNVMNVLSHFSATGATTEGVEKYLTELKAALNRDGSLVKDKVELIRLNQPRGAWAVISGSAAYILLFVELLPTQTTVDYQPLSGYIEYAHRALMEYNPKLALLNAPLVQPQDYGRVNNMARRIGNYLAVANMPVAEREKLNLSYLGQGTEYVIDADINNVRAFINQNSPHEVQARADIGFLVSVKQQKAPGAQQMLLDETRPIMAVTGFTDIVRRQFQEGEKFLPIVRITDIAPEIPLPGMIALAQACAVEEFILQQRWKQPFSSFAKGEPNVGNLADDPDDKNKLFFAKNPQERDVFINLNFVPPALAVDVTEGRDRIPHLAAYANPKKAGAVLDVIGQFFGARPNLNGPASAVDMVEYIGVDSTQGHLRDSRNNDYLNMVAKLGGLKDQGLSLLTYYQEPALRARALGALVPTFRSLHLNSTAVVSYELMSWLIQMVRSNMTIRATQTINPMASMQFAADQANYYKTHGFQSMLNYGARPMASWNGSYA